MKRLALALVPAVLVALAPAGPAAAGPRDEPGHPHGDPVLLALGDSVAAGAGAGATGAGYPQQVKDLLRDRYNTAADKATGRKGSSLELTSLAVPGATSVSLLRTQLEPALELIESRRADRDPKNDVEVITVTIGGNDLFTPVILACLPALPPQSPRLPVPAECQLATTTGLARVRTALTEALSALTAAAGRKTEVIVTTYYNPLRTCALGMALPVAGDLADVVLEGGEVRGLLTVQEGLNDIIRNAASATGAQVAELYGELAADDLVGGRDCLHPDLSGHTTIAEIVAGTLAG